MPSSTAALREIARWIAWDAFMFPEPVAGAQRQWLERLNEGEASPSRPRAR